MPMRRRKHSTHRPAGAFRSPFSVLRGASAPLGSPVGGSRPLIGSNLRDTEGLPSEATEHLRFLYLVFSHPPPGAPHRLPQNKSLCDPVRESVNTKAPLSIA